MIFYGQIHHIENEPFNMILKQTETIEKKFIFQ